MAEDAVLKVMTTRFLEDCSQKLEPTAQLLKLRSFYKCISYRMGIPGSEMDGDCCPYCYSSYNNRVMKVKPEIRPGRRMRQILKKIKAGKQVHPNAKKLAEKCISKNTVIITCQVCHKQVKTSLVKPKKRRIEVITLDNTPLKKKPKKISAIVNTHSVNKSKKVMTRNTVVPSRKGSSKSPKQPRKKTKETLLLKLINNKNEQANIQTNYLRQFFYNRM